jgi:hypothetical protein
VLIKNQTKKSEETAVMYEGNSRKHTIETRHFREGERKENKPNHQRHRRNKPECTSLVCLLTTNATLMN